MNMQRQAAGRMPMEKVKKSLEDLIAVAIHFNQTFAPQSYAWSGKRSRMGYEYP